MIDSEKLEDVVRSNIETLCRHFFPNGKKEGSEWKIANISGGKGDSLGICLLLNKAGLWHDRATGEGGKFVELFMRNRSLAFPAAAGEIGRCLGVDLEDHQQKRYSQNGASPIDWAGCRKLTPAQEERLAQGRGYTVEFVHWLSEHDLIRATGSNGSLKWVFPIHLNGKVAGTHSRPVEWTGPGRPKWRISPDKEDGGPGVKPLTIGDLASAQAVHVFESQWDMFAICDRLALHLTNGIASICTRGSGNGKLASIVPSTASEVFLWEQNDSAGKAWSDAVVQFLPVTAKAKAVYTPDQHEDANDWTAKGNPTAQQLVEAISAAVPLRARPKQEAAEGGPLRPMPSWIEYGQREVDRTLYHIGEGFLEVGGIVMLIGQSYAGKSTLLTQLAINIAIGREWLFFKLGRALRVLAVQAEDSQNKLVKMGHMFKRMELSEAELKLASQNTAVLTVRDLQGAKVITEIERHARELKPDIIILNPLTSFIGGSVYKEEAINEFLRTQLTPMLDRIKVSALVAHHPPKPTNSDKDSKELTAFELQYGGAGMAAITNVARGNMLLSHVNGDVFKLQVNKGFDDLGTKETTAFLRRSKDENGVMLWERCTSEKAEEATEQQAQRKAKKHSASDQFTPYDRLLKCLSATEKYTRDKLIQIAKDKLKKGMKWAEAAIRDLVHEKKLARTGEPNPRGGPRALFHLPTVLEPAE